MNKRFLLLICIGALLLCLTACGNEEGGATATPIPTMSPAPAATDVPEETEAPAATGEPTGEGEETTVPLSDGGDAGTGDSTALKDKTLAMAGADDAPEATPSGAVVTPGPEDTPILIDPIDKPTMVPAVLAYKTYTSNDLKISYDVPMTWSLYKPSESNMQFVEPVESAEEGYQAKLTVVAYGYGANQNAEDAKAKLLEIVNELSADPSWDSFEFSGNTEKTKMAGANGYYAYYDAVYNEVPLRGRIMVVAKGSSLYQVRITSVRARYSAYEEIYRTVRSTWKFL